jgi:hypothetical protein
MKISWKERKGRFSKEVDKTLERGFDIIHGSLYLAVALAGGAIKGFGKEDLQEMSAYELLRRLGTNSIRIRFCYEREGGEDGK